MDNNIIFALSVLFGLFIIFLLGAILGRYTGAWYRDHSKKRKIDVITVAEGTVFALLGLLIAFTFTGAYERYEARMHYIIDETNAIETAYMNVDLLAPQTQAELHNSIRQFLSTRIFIAKDLTSLHSGNLLPEYQLRKKIWEQTLNACKITNNPAVTQIVVPSITKVFEVATLRESVNRVHPPFVVFALLIGLAVLSSFLAGYSSAEHESVNLIYLLSYVIMISFTIYLIVDLELPRVGLVTVNSFDEILINLQQRL